MKKAWLTLLAAFIVLFGVGLSYLYASGKLDKEALGNRPEQQTITPPKNTADIQTAYDVIVVGTDPEGITAAVSAARNGLKTLLVEPRDSRNVLGGLMTEGWLNTIDMNYDKLNKASGSKESINKGLFAEWYGMVEGQSFDVNTAANAFYKLVKNEKKLDLLMHVKGVKPITNNEGQFVQVTGAEIAMSDGSTRQVSAKTVIDATQDADFAYAAGVPFSVGRSDIGDDKSIMGVTLVFKLSGIGQKEWDTIRASKEVGDSSEVSIAGFKNVFFDPNHKPYYTAHNPKQIKVRGLNIGRQNDNTVLINAMLIFGVNAFDPESVAAGKAAGEEELPYLVDFLNKNIPGFEKAKLAGTAPELYVRETRQMEGLYKLGILDLLENKDQPDRVALGSYPSDVQPLDPSHNGIVYLTPVQYAVPLRSLIPANADGLLVVGRSASYGSLAQGSARMIPTGMDEGQSAGIAAKVAIESGVSFRNLVDSPDLLNKLHDLAIAQKMNMGSFTVPKAAYMNHKYYEGLKVALYHGLVSGSYNNDFDIDGASNPNRVKYNLNAIKNFYSKTNPVFKGNPIGEMDKLLAGADGAKAPLSLAQLSYDMGKTLGLDVTPDNAETEITAKGIIKKETVDGIVDKEKLTNGEVWMLYRDMLERVVNLKL
ncbi:FAD-dependent oxidoreductase [Gorillibacterium massiliense]|uniref:FAD-dependent oxidoreductase n=1 Tax=Gorillibacterium massiliense TaxID=1280390 RepID=UPI0004B73AE8|nr:FAD-dependent oxidoreductase [Gorillibacterium massiliense]